jgi:hypothetical protein
LKEIRARREDVMAKLDAYQPKTDVVFLAIIVMDPSHMEMVDEATPERYIETMACQEMEARLEEKEPTSVDRKPEVAQHREAPLKTP